MATATEHKSSTGQACAQSFTYSVTGVDATGMVNGMARVGVAPIVPAIMNAVYDKANRMKKFNGTDITYDANGNPLNHNGMSLTWNQKSQLTHVSGAAAGPIEYRYDAMGRRVSKIVNSVTTNYLYDGMNLIAELDGDNSNAVIAWYVYAGLDKPLARVDASDGSVLYYHQDLLGSVIALTNSSGAVVTQYNYSPFGHTEVIGTDIDQPFRFTGREWDAETGLYYYRARYYSPDMRRFISEDPLRFAAGDVNFYAYVGNNPVNFIDPLGLYWVYYQSSGNLRYIDDDTGVETYIGTGYSGHRTGINNPSLQHVEDVGPIPQGMWNIGPAYDSKTGRGPVTMNLTPASGTKTFGRDLFRIHGDTKYTNYTASLGCIVLARSIREQINRSGDRRLCVKP